MFPRTVADVYQENFKKWAIQHLSDHFEQAGIHGLRRLTLRELLDAFHVLPETEQHEITPHVPAHYFKSATGFRLDMDILYKKSLR